MCGLPWNPTLVILDKISTPLLYHMLNVKLYTTNNYLQFTVPSPWYNGKHTQIFTKTKQGLNIVINMVRITYLQFNLLLFIPLLMILKNGFLNECEYGLLIICGWDYLYFSTWNYYKLIKLPSLTGCLWTALRNEKKLHPRMCFCKEQFLPDFFTSNSKNRIENLPIFYI